MPVTPEQVDVWRASPTETQNLEFKEARNQYDTDKLFRYCVAIANEGGGHLILGVANKPPREVIGTKAFYNHIALAETIFQAVRFRVDIDEVSHPAGRVLVFSIPSRPKGIAYHLEGKYLMRLGESLAPMSQDQLRKIFEETRNWSRPFWAAMIIMALFGCALFLVWHKGRPSGESLHPHAPTAAEIADELDKRQSKNRSTTTEARPPVSPEAVQPKQPFAIEVEYSALRADSSEWMTGFWFKYQTSEGFVLVPTNLALFLRFVNLQPFDAHLDNYKVEMRAHDEWVALTRIDTHAATAYNAYPTSGHATIEDCLKYAWLTDFSGNGLDQQLLKAKGRVPANDMVRGWAFFEYPPGIRGLTGTERLRVTLTDIAGKTEQHIHERSEELNSNNVLGLPLHKLPGGPFDISGIPIRRWPLGEPTIIPD